MDAAPRKLRSIAAASAAAFVLVCALAFLFAAPAIEAKLQAGARAALDAAGIAGITATLDGRTATLEGAVADEAARAAAIAAVAAVPGIAAVVDHVQAGGAAEAPAQYLFSAVWDGRTLTLTGHMPGRDARAERRLSRAGSAGNQDILAALDRLLEKFDVLPCVEQIAQFNIERRDLPGCDLRLAKQPTALEILHRQRHR